MDCAAITSSRKGREQYEGAREWARDGSDLAVERKASLLQRRPGKLSSARY
jgi:hypothetical protein